MNTAYLKKLHALFLLAVLSFTAFAAETSPFNDQLKEVPQIVTTHEGEKEADSIIVSKEKTKEKEKDPNWHVGLEIQRSPVKTENPDPIRRDSMGGVVKGYFHF